MNGAFSITAAELAARGFDDLPEELNSAKHMIYSSPATLDYNSPGAKGFGVKRAGLAIPGSVMLLVAPGCCGRNTALLNELGYSERFFYLMLDDTDIVTGRYLKKIPQACAELLEECETKPSAVVICITCVDALLGTDMERVCRACAEKTGVATIPAYMYALTREKRLRSAGIKTIGEIGRCTTFEEYSALSKANFNLVLNAETRHAAQDMQERLGIPFIELTRLFRLDKIRNQYRLLGQALGVTFDDADCYQTALESVERFQDKYGNVKIAVGECLNADSFELALALTEYGCTVPEIYGTVGERNFVFIKKLAEISPNTRIYSNLSPTMLNYRRDCEISAVIGNDAMYYHRDLPGIGFQEEAQPFGYRGVTLLFEGLTAALEGRT